jgi:hypothetical protein
VRTIAIVSATVTRRTAKTVFAMTATTLGIAVTNAAVDFIEFTLALGIAVRVVVALGVAATGSRTARLALRDVARTGEAWVGAACVGDGASVAGRIVRRIIERAAL